MRKLAPLFVVFISSMTIGNAQNCTPDPLYQDSLFGIWPDTIDNLPCTLPNVFYATDVQFKAPVDAGELDPAYAGLIVSWIRLDSIAGLPAGVGFQCNTASNCQWNGGTQGCVSIFGTVTTPGTYDLTIWITAKVSILTIPQSFGGYRLVVDTSCGGGSSLTATITETSSIDCDSNCNGSLTAMASGGTTPYSYQWTSNTGGQTTATVSGLCADSYTVTITDSLNDTTMQTYNLTEPSALIVDTSSTASCPTNNSGTGRVNVTGGVSPYTYLWADGQTTATASGLGADSISVTVTDANGCLSYATAIIAQYTAMSTSISNTSTSCVGGVNGSAQITVTIGLSPFSYIWSNGATNSNPTGLNAGTYFVTITDANNCTAVDSTTLIDGTGGPITGSILGSPTAAEFSTGIYSVPLTMGSIYTWVITGGIQISGGTTNSITVQWASSGLGNVQVVETDSILCDGDTVMLSVTIGTGVGIVERSKSAYSIYPNPTKEVITIETTESDIIDLLEVYDVVGKLVFQVNAMGETIHTIDMINLSNGVYFLKITGFKETEVHRILKE